MDSDALNTFLTVHRRGGVSNAARVLQNFLYTAKIQQLLVNDGGQRSMHPDVTEPADRTPLKDIKLLPDDPSALLPQIADVKKRYTAIFGN